MINAPPRHVRFRACPHARNGFTLVELLAVVAIIALLALLITPAISSAINSSRGAKSLSNLKQIGQLALTWAADHNGRLPLTSDQSQTYWFRLLEEDVLGWKRGGVNGNSVPPLFRCPLLNRRPLSEPQATPDYGSNTWVLLQSNGGSPSPNHPWPANPLERGLFIHALPRPSKTIMFTTGDTWLIGRGFVTDASSTAILPLLQNGQAFGAAFCDGHVEVIRGAKIYDDQDKMANRSALFDPFYEK